MHLETLRQRGMEWRGVLAARAEMTENYSQISAGTLVAASTVLTQLSSTPLPS